MTTINSDESQCNASDEWVKFDTA